MPPDTKWVPYIRDLWGKPPFFWRRVRLIYGKILTTEFATEEVCLDALRKRYRETDTNGNSRYSLLALPVGESWRLTQDAGGT